MSKIDLHIHSYYSDGEDSPEDLKILMEQGEVSLFSLTDHNYIYPGVQKLTNHGSAKFIQGVEISSVDRVTGQSLHILGYSYDFDIPVLNKSLIPILEGYNNRAKEIIKQLNQRFGSHFDFDTIKKEIPAMFISRNLLANKLVQFLGNKLTIAEAVKECFVTEDDSWMPDTGQAIKLINDCGGVAVLAHSGGLLKKIDLRELIGRLVKVGLFGIEVYYPRHDEETTKVLLDIAQDYNLLITGGSDWHGKNLPRAGVSVEVPNSIYNMCVSNLKII